MTTKDPTPPAAASDFSDALHTAVCNAAILLNNGEEIAPRVSSILREALFNYAPIQSAQPSGVAGDDFDLSTVARMLRVYSGTTTAHANGDAMEASALSRQLTDAPPIAQQGGGEVES